MARLVTAKVIYNGLTNEFVANDPNALVTITCENLSAYSPRQVWLQRWLAPGDGTLIMYQPTFQLTSADVAAYGANLIQGLWIQTLDGVPVMIDVLDLQTFLTACNGCCDDDVPVPITPYYSTGVPSFTYPTTTSYCIARVDDGSADAFNNFALDYNPLQGINIVQMRSHASGISYYDVTSAIVPVPLGTDVVTAGACVSQ